MPLTIAQWITQMAEYPSDSVVQLIGNAMCFDAPDGGHAAPITVPEADKPQTPEQAAQVRQALLDAQLQLGYWVGRVGTLSAALRDVEEVSA